MRCSLCKKKAVIKHPRFCKEHFIKYYENKVGKVLDRIKGSSVLVALSGGKDSSALAYAMQKQAKKYNIKITLCFIDIGVNTISKEWKPKAEKLGAELDLPLHIIKLQDFKTSIPELSEKINRVPCSICGIAKRYLLNKTAQEKNFDYVATGHNLDDTYYFFMHSLHQQDLKGILRYGKILRPDIKNNLAGRIRPQIYLTEHENKLYCEINEIPFSSVTCPYSQESSQQKFKKENTETPRHQKLNLVRSIRRLRNKSPLLEEEKKSTEYTLNPCVSCGFPTTTKRNKCSFCSMVEDY